MYYDPNDKKVKVEAYLIADLYPGQIEGPLGNIFSDQLYIERLLESLKKIPATTEKKRKKHTTISEVDTDVNPN